MPYRYETPAVSNRETAGVLCLSKSVRTEQLVVNDIAGAAIGRPHRSGYRAFPISGVLSMP